MSVARALARPQDLGPRMKVALGVLFGACIGALLTAAPVPAALTLLAVLGLAVAALTWFRPDIALVVVLAVLPFQPLIFGWLIARGIAPPWVLALRYWHTLILLLLVARAALTWPKRLNAVDRVALIYLALVGIAVVSGGQPLFQALVLARPFGAFIVMFLAARWLPLPAWTSRAVQVAMLACGLVLGIGAAFNEFAPEAFARWVDGSGMLFYQRLLGAGTAFVIDYSDLAGHRVVRAGSLLLSSLGLAHFMLIPTGVALGLAAMGRLRGWLVVAGLASAAGLLMTLTRSAILTIPVMVLLVLMMTNRGRGRLLSTVAGAAVVLYPVSSMLGVGDQIQAGFDLQQARTAGHLARSGAALTAVLRHPLGEGFKPTFFLAENWYLQFGLITGLAGTLVAGLLVVLTLRELWRRGRLGDADAVAAFCALGALALSALALFAFGDIAATYPVWVLAGLATNLHRAAPQPVPAVAPPATVDPRQVSPGPRPRPTLQSPGRRTEPG